MKSSIRNRFFLCAVLLFGLTGCDKQPVAEQAEQSPTVSRVQRLLALGPIHQLLNNFYTVESGKLYRSAQLSPEWLAYYIKRYGLKTVINLRGEQSSELWWRNEKQLTDALDVTLYNIPMASHELSTKEHLTTLLDLFDKAEQPILVHCHVGADRTGEAAALWKLEQEKKSKSEALGQLSFLYRHRRTKHPAKRYLIEIWQGRDWLKSEFEHMEHPSSVTR